MIALQSAMLIALGLFLAGFLMFIFAPLYRRRAERLATDALRASMPMSEAEIRADKDRLRAEQAIVVHQLETKAEQQDLAAARQMVEINRRDALISALEGQLAETRTKLDEHENARRVLEQTITDRLPRVEARLLQAKAQLDERDQEIAKLIQAQQTYSSALNEAQQINRQQREELARSSSSLATRSNRNRDAGGNDIEDSSVALRAEIEALRAKSRDQASLIERLQGAATSLAVPGSIFAHLGEPSNDMRANADAELGRLKQSLADAEQAMKSAAGEPDEVKFALEKQLQVQASLIDSHETEIARVKSQLAAANDRLAQQAAKHNEELARAAQVVEAENARAAAAAEPRKVSLMDRISQPRAEAPAGAVAKNGPDGDAPQHLKVVAEPEAPAEPGPRVHRGGLIERLASAASKPAAPGE